eukprot:7096999-Pyramimonas_sp.AAC.1
MVWSRTLHAEGSTPVSRIRPATATREWPRGSRSTSIEGRCVWRSCRHRQKPDALEAQLSLLPRVPA